MSTRAAGLPAVLTAALLVATLAGCAMTARSPGTPTATPAAVPAATPAATLAATPAPEAGPLAPLAWLAGCWRGSVNQRDYREHWMPLRGNLLIGTSQTVTGGKVQAFEYLRIELRDGDVYYVAAPSGKGETAFRLAEQSVDRSGDRNDEIFKFVHPTLEFPQKITYRRASEGWLYAEVEGKVNGVVRLVTYPMRRIGCESGEFIRH